MSNEEIEDQRLHCLVQSHRKQQRQDLNPVVSVPDSKVRLSPLSYTAFLRLLSGPSTQHWAAVSVLSDGMSDKKALHHTEVSEDVSSKRVWDERGHMPPKKVHFLEEGPP